MIVTAYDRMLLAGFDYDGKPSPSIPLIDTQNKRREMYLLERCGLPWILEYEAGTCRWNR